MSGICGIVSLDGTNASETAITIMTSCLERRGPDGTHVMVDGPAALGHTSLATTPEALVEVLPLADPVSGFTITADARLDNRDELIEALDLAPQTRVIGDGELILRAYLEWGDRCPSHLLGDFAFAIWDPRSASLFCARDQVGGRQLLYHHAPGLNFVFATEPGAILALPQVNAPLNPDRLSDFLSNMESADLTSTFFSTIFRLPPGHILKLDHGRIELICYWELGPEPELKLPSVEAYEAAFLEVFTQAVRSRMRSTGKIGVMVSGGVDSNSIAAVAARLLTEQSLGPLPTFSAIGPDPADCVETQGVLTAINSPLFAPTTINYAVLGPYRAELAREVAGSAEPFDPKMTLLRAVYLAANRQGVKIMLDGGAGDTLLGADFHIAFLLRRGRLGRAVREARGDQRFWGSSTPAWRSLAAAAWQAFAPTSLRAWRFKRGRRHADRQFRDYALTVVPKLDLQRSLARRAQVQQRDFRLDCVDRLTRPRLMMHPGCVAGLERYERIASSLAIEPRDPFTDLRLMRFCLSLPRNQIQRDGWPKWILRRAMTHTVPGSILWRRGKHHLGYDFIDRLMEEPSGNVWKNTDLPATKKAILKYDIVFLSDWIRTVRDKGWIAGPVLLGDLIDDECK